MRNLLSETSKLNRIPCFNISTESCKHATVECKKYCYAKHHNFVNPRVKNKLEYNYSISKNDDFVNKLHYQINPIVAYFRIHASGDFYSQTYYENWIEIANRNKDIKFMAYTRNYDVNLTIAPSNLKIFYSFDDSSERLNNTAKQLSYVGDYNLKFKRHLEKIKIMGIEFRICNAKDCSTCLFCWKTTKNIVFPNKYKNAGGYLNRSRIK